MLLTHEEFVATIAEPMSELLDPEATTFIRSIPGLTPYLNAVPERDLQGYALLLFTANRLMVSGTLEHAQLLYFTVNSNAMLVVIVRVSSREIVGHYFLDLNVEYGLIPTAS